MKKLLFVTVLALVSVMVYAQPRAIGARVGGFDGVSYQHGFGNSNMLEVEAGFGICGGIDNFAGGWVTAQAAVTYDWIDPFGKTIPWDEDGEWHWYMGVGGAVGYIAGNAGFVGAAGRVGIEYDFKFPLQISIDYRPVIGAAFSSGYAGCYWDLWGAALGLGLRYKF